MNALRSIFLFFKSVRLALLLIVLIVVLSLLATLVPQGRPESWYQARYAPGILAVITFLHLAGFFRSAIFLVPIGFFTASLACCTVDRLVRRVRTGAPHRYGPDLVHIGLLVLVAGGLVTAMGRQETTWSLGEGDEAGIGSGYTLRLVSFQYLRYDNGSPRDWISTVNVAREGRDEIAAFPIEVNHPLRLKGITVFQSTFEVNGTLRLRDPEGADVAPPEPGRFLRTRRLPIRLHGLPEGRAGLDGAFRALQERGARAGNDSPPGGHDWSVHRGRNHGAGGHGSEGGA